MEKPAGNPYNLARMEFTTAELRSLPEDHAACFVISCLAINEVGVIQKTLLMALTARKLVPEKAEPPLHEIAYAQSIIIMRNLGAKIIEYLKMTNILSHARKRRVPR
jgi:hypothetical protein